MYRYIVYNSSVFPYLHTHFSLTFGLINIQCLYFTCGFTHNAGTSFAKLYVI